METSGVISKRSSTAIANRSARPHGTDPRLQRGYRRRTPGRYCRTTDRASREYGRGPGRGALRRGLDRARPESWLTQQAHYDLAHLRTTHIKLKRLQFA